MAGRGSSTSRFNLTDEYLKAKREAFTEGNQQNSGNKRKKLQDIIKYRHAEKQEKEAARLAKAEKRAAKIALTAAEEQALCRSESILRAKSEIYEKLSNSRKGDLPETVLVDFSAKDTNAIPYDYIDKRPVYHDDEANPEVDCGPSEVHFSNVDHGEVRSKGVGFYAFSENPELRKQQMDFLNSMRESTERSREQFLVAKEKRGTAKLQRLNRIRKKHCLSPLEYLPGAKIPAAAPSEKVPSGDPQEPPDMPPDGAPNVASLEEQFMQRQRSLWEERVEQLRNEREAMFAPSYGDEDEDLDEDSQAITNFISFVRNRT